jgi:zinc/manganese transport system substrate-binding protein
MTKKLGRNLRRAMTALVVSGTLAAAPAQAKLKVFACEPEWASLATELGGDLVDVYAASTAMQDAHRIEARPSLVARMRSADLVVCTGADLEVGWLPVLLQSGGNTRVQPATNGYFAAADFVARLEVPNVLDRAAGDIHPGGNPHVHLDAHNIAKIAAALSVRLAAIDAAHASDYRARGDDFAQRWQAATLRWEAEGAPLAGMRFVSYHKDLVYLAHWLKLVEVANIEPKPGLPPTAAHLADLVGKLGAPSAGEKGTDVITRNPFQDPKPAEWLADQTHVPLVTLPFTVGGSATATDLFKLYDETLSLLLGARH